LIGRNFASEMGRKKERDQSNFFYESEESEEEFPPKKHSNHPQLKMKNQKKNENGKKEDTSTKLSRNSNESIFSPCRTRENCKNRIRQKEKRAREIRICNAMELRDIKICIFQISLAVLVISSKASFF
jgi:hypothetical protein